MCHPCSNVMLMVRHAIKAVTYSPLYIHSFRLVQPQTLVEAEKFNLRYSDPSQIDNTPDRLRWYRYQKGLLQRDVAEYVGMDRSTYSSYEEMGRDYYPIDRMKKLAELFEVSRHCWMNITCFFITNRESKSRPCGPPEI